jgi:large subunit ribosomal protein L5
MADDKKPKGDKAEKAEKAKGGEKDAGARDKGAKAAAGGKGGGKRDGKRGESRGGGAATVEAVSSGAEIVAPRLAEKYRDQAVAALTKQFNYKNPMQVPRLEKIVVNMGLGAAVANPKIIDTAVEELKAITGQKPVVTRAKKAIANFKLRAGIPIGAMVTLRRGRMWEFLDRLVSVGLPRMRDFKGVSRKAFDGKGNYTLGLREQIIFPEIDYDKIDAIKGLNISFVTTAQTDEEGRALLQQLGMPFRAA